MTDLISEQTKIKMMEELLKKPTTTQAPPQVPQQTTTPAAPQDAAHIKEIRLLTILHLYPNGQTYVKYTKILGMENYIKKPKKQKKKVDFKGMTQKKVTEL